MNRQLFCCSGTIFRKRISLPSVNKTDLISFSSSGLKYRLNICIHSYRTSTAFTGSYVSGGPASLLEFLNTTLKTVICSNNFTASNSKPPQVSPSFSARYEILASDCRRYSSWDLGSVWQKSLPSLPPPGDWVPIRNRQQPFCRSIGSSKCSPRLPGTLSIPPTPPRSLPCICCFHFLPVFSKADSLIKSVS